MALALTLKVGERVFVDGKIDFKVVAIESGRIKVAIQAPPNIPIRREKTLTDDEVRDIEVASRKL